MGQKQDETGQAERAGERYEAARAKLAHLIDHPEKHLSVAEYRSHIKAAQRAVAAAYKATQTNG